MLYFGRALLPRMKRRVRCVHRLFSFSRATVRHPGDLLSGGRVQDGEYGGCGDPSAVHVALGPQQRIGDVQAVVPAASCAQHGSSCSRGVREDEPKKTATSQQTKSGHCTALRSILTGRFTDPEPALFPSVLTGPDENVLITWHYTIQSPLSGSLCWASVIIVYLNLKRVNW